MDSSDEDPRSKFKKTVLDTLTSSGFPPTDIEAVQRALDERTLDRLFTRATATVSAASPPVAVRVVEWYMGDAATAFAAREKREGGVEIHGSVRGIVAGGSVLDSEVSVSDATSETVMISYGRLALEDLRNAGIDTSEGETIFREYEQGEKEARQNAFHRFVDWLKRHASDLSSSGLATLSILLEVTKR